MEESTSFKKSIVFVIIIILVVVGVFLFFKKTRTIAYEFSGNLVSIEGKEIIVLGVYIDDDIDNAEQEPKEVRVLVTDLTEIEKSLFNVPNTDEMFRPSELSKEVSLVDINTLEEDSTQRVIGLLIRSDKNIFNKDRFEARAVSYLFPIFSDQ
jgi:hypothetical protein